MLQGGFYAPDRRAVAGFSRSCVAISPLARTTSRNSACTRSGLLVLDLSFALLLVALDILLSKWPGLSVVRPPDIASTLMRSVSPLWGTRNPVILVDHTGFSSRERIRLSRA